jgi:hypothetical protein
VSCQLRVAQVTQWCAELRGVEKNGGLTTVVTGAQEHCSSGRLSTRCPAHVVWTRVLLSSVTNVTRTRYCWQYARVCSDKPSVEKLALMLWLDWVT